MNGWSTWYVGGLLNYPAYQKGTTLYNNPVTICQIYWLLRCLSKFLNSRNLTKYIQYKGFFAGNTTDNDIDIWQNVRKQELHGQIFILVASFLGVET